MSGDAQNNAVHISGGTVNRNIYGGFSLVSGSETGSATGNTVTLSGTPVLGAATALYGGFVGTNSGATPAPSTDAFTGNTLNLKTSGLSVAGTGTLGQPHRHGNQPHQDQ
ncbi:MAG: hypothetical protein LBR88_01990, partial [Zoogloeaceae bacterium]|jgi:hypothetical protein|nr:hypothetical protein [Zoogloeaceae bacterium]